MSEQRCHPIRKCEVIEEQDESDIIDSGKYCYNITGRTEICQPKTCTFKRRTEKYDFCISDQAHFEDRSLITQVYNKSDNGTRVSRKYLQNKDVENIEEKEIQANLVESDRISITGGARENSQVQENVNLTKKITPTDRHTSSKDKILTENSYENLINMNKISSGVSSERVNERNRTSGPSKQVSPEKLREQIESATVSEQASSEKSGKPKDISIAVDECPCCNCNPCDCGPKGYAVENIIAALKLVQNSDELEKFLRELTPEGVSVIDDILIKEGAEAALWAAGGAMNFMRDIEDDNLKEVIREAWIKGYFDEKASCHCLPHMCPCPGDHHVYGTSKDVDAQKANKKLREQMNEKDSHKNKKKMSEDKKHQQIPKQNQIGQHGENLVIKRKLSETCVCPPTKHYLTPATSGSVSSDHTVRSRRTFWRDLMICSCPKLERTLAILKSDVVQYRDVVLRAIHHYGLDIVNERRVQLTPEEASELHVKYYGRTQFPNMIVSISYAPIIAFSLGGISVVEHWKHIIGPDGVLPSEWFLTDWIERKYGLFCDMPETLHASANLASAEMENRYFFPDSILDPLMSSSEDVSEYFNKFVNPTLLNGLAVLTKSKPTDAITFLAEWLLYNNPFQPQFPAKVCLAPT